LLLAPFFGIQYVGGKAVVLERISAGLLKVRIFFNGSIREKLESKTGVVLTDYGSPVAENSMFVLVRRAVRGGVG
jgi:hypothetical protein